MYCAHWTRYYVIHSKFIIFGDNFALTYSNFTKFGKQLSRIWIHMSAKFHWCRYNDRHFRASWSYFWNFLENGEFGGHFSQSQSVIRLYNFVYGWKGHIFKYLNPIKGTGLPSHYGDTATDRKPISRTLEGAIYVVQSHWSVKFGMAMCNYEIKILWDLNTKRNLYEKVMAVLDYLGVHFSRTWEIFDGVGFRFKFRVWRWHFEGQVISRRWKNISQTI